MDARHELEPAHFSSLATSRSNRRMVNQCKVALDISMKGRHQKNATTNKIVVTNAPNLLRFEPKFVEREMTANCATNKPM